jgi:glutathione S-transferase
MGVGAALVPGGATWRTKRSPFGGHWGEGNVPVPAVHIMKIYGDVRSGNCDKVRFTVDYLRLPYEWVEVDSVAGGTRTPEFLAMNPQGQVPVVQLAGGQFLAQSNAIVRHIANGSRLSPGDTWSRAKIDEWMFWESNNHEFFVAGCIAHMTYMAKSKDTRDAMRVERGDRALDIMERHLRASQWLVGENITLADVTLLAYTRRAHLGGFDMLRRPKLREWVRRCEAELGLASV